MNRSNKKILVVEDDGALLNILASRVESLGYEAVKACDGEEAMDLFAKEKPALILLDILLPKVNGFEVLKRVRSYPDPEQSAVPVIVLSNLWSDKDILAAQALRIEEYYVKAHSSLEDVFKKVSEVLSKN